MNIKIIGYIAAGLIFLVLVGGLGYVIVRPTNKTVVGQGGRVVNLNTEKPSVPLGGCSIWRVNLKTYWEKGFNTSEVKK